ncbi:hypothetical protein DEU56DRAFT_788666 [Suillus clintonianus]|uniref:uncharacterized protein n=1 Tax=Suillus clintonianus TaxID=1904413 RepID=UPI001B87416B|nr:uncharacterized protein DEU56DRAFT_788666 [Suillus clintonianus]KAG2145888.1 hypothetical protein DEU56DRAFT_788666 [Suillus clintonianus]
MFAFTTLLCTISSLALLALSLPLKLRDVVDPPITSPTAGTVWHVGDKQLVTWSTSGLSSNITNPVGMLVLGYSYNNSENLMLDSPLATNINYTLGQVLITVPDVETREDYIVVLFGDSGNASPEFTIINDSSSSSASAPSTSSSVQLTTPGTSASPTTQTPTETTTTSNSVNSTPTTTSGITPAAGVTTPTLSSGITSVITSTATPTQTTLTGAAWRNHASGASIMLALVSLVYIF